MLGRAPMAVCRGCGRSTFGITLLPMLTGVSMRFWSGRSIVWVEQETTHRKVRDEWSTLSFLQHLFAAGVTMTSIPIASRYNRISRSALPNGRGEIRTPIGSA